MFGYLECFGFIIEKLRILDFQIPDKILIKYRNIGITVSSPLIMKPLINRIFDP